MALKTLSPIEHFNLRSTLNHLRQIVDDLPEEITLEDVKEHAWLVDLICLAARVEGAANYSAYVYAKEQG